MNVIFVWQRQNPTEREFPLHNLIFYADTFEDAEKKFWDFGPMLTANTKILVITCDSNGVSSFDYYEALPKPRTNLHLVKRRSW